MAASGSKPDSDAIGAATPVSADRAAPEVRFGEPSRDAAGRRERGRQGARRAGRAGRAGRADELPRGGSGRGAPGEDGEGGDDAEETAAGAVLEQALAAAGEISGLAKDGTQAAIKAAGGGDDEEEEEEEEEEVMEEEEEEGEREGERGGAKGARENGDGAGSRGEGRSAAVDGPRATAPDAGAARARGATSAPEGVSHQPAHVSFHWPAAPAPSAPGDAAQAPTPARQSPRPGARPPGILRSRDSSFADLASPDALAHDGRGSSSGPPPALPRIPSHSHVALAAQQPPPSAVFPVLAQPPLASTPSLGGVAFFSSPVAPPSLGGSRNPSLDGLCLRGGSRSSREASVDALARITRDELRSRSKREPSLVREARRRLSASLDGSHEDGRGVEGDEDASPAAASAGRGRRSHGRHHGHRGGPLPGADTHESTVEPLRSPHEAPLRRSSASFADLGDGREGDDRGTSLSIEPHEGIPSERGGLRGAISEGVEDVDLDAALDALRHPSLLPPGHAHLYPPAAPHAPSLSFSAAPGRPLHASPDLPDDRYPHSSDRAPPPSRHLSRSGSRAHMAGQGYGSHGYLTAEGYGSHGHLATEGHGSHGHLATEGYGSHGHLATEGYGSHAHFFDHQGYGLRGDPSALPCGPAGHPAVEGRGSHAHLATEAYGSHAHLATEEYGSHGHLAGLDGGGHVARGSSTALHVSPHRHPHALHGLERGSRRPQAMARSRSHPQLPAGGGSARRASVGPADEDLLSALLRGPAPAGSASAGRGAASGGTGPVAPEPASASVSSGEPASPAALPPLPPTLPQRLLKGAYEVLESVLTLPALRSPVAPLVLGYLFTYYNGKTTEERKAQIERANAQVRLLYGPLFAITSATRSAYAAMVRQHSPDGTVAGFVHAVRSDPTSSEAMAYRRWMLDVIQPLNDRAVEVIVAHTDLLEEPSLDDQLLHFVAHASAWKVITARWRAGDLSEWSAITYPNQLPDMVERAFQRIKSKQARLLGESGGYAGGKALRNVGRLGAWLWDGARWATAGAAGRGGGSSGGARRYEDDGDDDEDEDDDEEEAGGGGGPRGSGGSFAPRAGAAGGGGARARTGYASYVGRGGYGAISRGYGAPRHPRRPEPAASGGSAVASPPAASGGYDPKTGYDGRNGSPGLPPGTPAPYTPPPSSERARSRAESSARREAGSGVDMASKQAAWGGAKRSPQIPSSERLQPQLNEVRGHNAAPSAFLKAAEDGIRKAQAGGGRSKL